MRQDVNLKTPRLALLGFMFATTWDCFLLWIIAEASTKQNKLDLMGYLIVSLVCTVWLGYVFVTNYERVRKQ